MKARIRRVGVRSVFLLFLVIYGVVGLVVGGAVAILGSLGMAPEAASTAVDALGWWALPVFAMVYGLVGGLAGAVAAALYNTAAGFTGGVRMDLREMREPTRVRVERVQEGDDVGAAGGEPSARPTNGEHGPEEDGPEGGVPEEGGGES